MINYTNSGFVDVSFFVVVVVVNARTKYSPLKTRGSHNQMQNNHVILQTR